jgi:hypothetical protein
MQPHFQETCAFLPQCKLVWKHATALIFLLAYAADLSCSLLNPIHVAAIFRKLASICQPPNPTYNAAAAAAPLAAGVPAEACEALLQHLQQQIKQQRCMGHGPRGLANILAAIAKLQCVPDVELLPMLLDSFCCQIAGAVPQDVANVLWSVAQITLAYGVGSAPLVSSSSSSALQEAQGAAAVVAAGAADDTAGAALGEHGGTLALADASPSGEAAAGAAAGQGQLQQGLRLHATSAEPSCSGPDAVKQAGPDQQQQQEQRLATTTSTAAEASKAAAASH